MRKVLNDIEIVGATMCYREHNQCRWTLDWLCDFCDRVIILLDNFDSQTEQIVLEYKGKFKDKVNIIYSTEPIREEKNLIQGQIKKRWKNRQPFIREQVIQELHKMNKDKPVDLFIFFDSDEIPIDQFPSILEDFWYKKEYDSMTVGFVEIYDSWRILISQKMAPHSRIFRYKPEMTAIPYQPRTNYFPFNLKRPLKIRHIMVHLNHFTEEYRKRRRFFDNVDMMTECVRYAWFLPKDVRQMTTVEIADYQPGFRQAPSRYPPILLQEYIDNKGKFNEYLT